MNGFCRGMIFLLAGLAKNLKTHIYFGFSSLDCTLFINSQWNVLYIHLYFLHFFCFSNIIINHNFHDFVHNISEDCIRTKIGHKKVVQTILQLLLDRKFMPKLLQNNTVT